MPSTDDEHFDGEAFEFYVASELLLRGLNCSMPAVDVGIDLIAWKTWNTSPLKLQVKGRNFSGHGTNVESYRFRKTSYQNRSTKPDYVIMILRYTKAARTNPSYGTMNRLIIPVDTFDNLVKKGLVTERGDYLVANIWANFRKGVATKVVFQKGYGKRRPGKVMTRFLDAWRPFG
jgi:hypothetical protein